MVQHTVDEIILQEKQKLSVKDETHDNIDDKVDEDELYNLDKTILDENKQREGVFERKLIMIYDIKRPNSMNRIHDNEVNKISE